MLELLPGSAITVEFVALRHTILSFSRGFFQKKNNQSDNFFEDCFL